MKNALQKFYLSKGVLVACIILSLGFWAAWTMIEAEAGVLALAGDGIVYMGLIVGLLAAYVNGETNVQKALIGALLVFLVDSNVEMVFAYKEAGDTMIVVTTVATLVLSVAMFLSYVILQSDHVGAQKGIVFSWVCGLTSVILLVLLVRQALFADGTVTEFTYLPAWVLTFQMLMCMQSRIQAYKSIRAESRANGSWTEEKRQETKNLFKF